LGGNGKTLMFISTFIQHNIIQQYLLYM